MSDEKPVTIEELQKAKLELLTAIAHIDRSMEGMRSQNSAEHSSILGKLGYVTEMLVWLKTQWIRFSRTEPPPPNGKIQ